MAMMVAASQVSPASSGQSIGTRSSAYSISPRTLRGAVANSTARALPAAVRLSSNRPMAMTATA